VRVFRRPGPRHELVEARGRLEIGEPGEHVGEVGLRVDAVQFAGLCAPRAGPITARLKADWLQPLLYLCQLSNIISPFVPINTKPLSS